MTAIVQGSTEWHQAVQLARRVYDHSGTNWEAALAQLIVIAHDRNQPETYVTIVEAGKLIRMWLANGTLKPKEI